MSLNAIEILLNTAAFKTRVEDLFPKSMSAEIDFDFKISITDLKNNQFQVRTLDNSYDCDGVGIPSMIATVFVAVLDSVDLENSVLQQFQQEIASM